MNPEICLSLDKITFPKYFQHLSHLSFYILTDSGFQHLILNRQVKNQTANLFGQKIFLPHFTKQVLFDICSSKRYNPQLRICSFAYEIKNLILDSQNHIISECNEIYNDFSFSFSVQLSLGIDTNTHIGTLSQFSSNEKHQQWNKKPTANFQINIDDQELEIPRIYSPKNISMKLLEAANEESWEIKSEYSPSKTKIQIRNTQEKYWDKLEKRQTSQSLTLESESLKKSQYILPVRKNLSQKHSFIKLRKAEVTEERELSKKEASKSTKLGTLIEYKDFLLFGGILGVFTAVLSTEFLIV